MILSALVYNSAQLALASGRPNENGQLPMVDALLDQREGKFCLSYKINSIFSGSCAQNNSYSVAPAVFYFAANCVSQASTILQVIVCSLMCTQREGEVQLTCMYVRRPVMHGALEDTPWPFRTLPGLCSWRSIMKGTPNACNSYTELSPY